MFTVVLNRPNKSSQKSSQKILEIIQINPEITIQELAEKIGLTSRSVGRQIALMKKHGYLERSGSNKAGTWLILKNDKNH